MPPSRADDRIIGTANGMARGIGRVAARDTKALMQVSREAGRHQASGSGSDPLISSASSTRETQL